MTRIPLKTIFVICGPTAGGKSARALELAVKQNGVIINADSMQVYNVLPILTAQPSPEDKRRVPHTLYGVLHPREKSSAGEWCKMAVTEIEKAFSGGQTSVICGGTGLYIKTLMEGLSPIPPVPQEVREKIIRLQQELGNPGFYEAFKKIDPAMAARFHPNHTARLLRAWEVLEATGRSLADWQKEDKAAPPADWNFEVEFINPERDILHERINTRFEKMLEDGALEEVKDLSGKIESGEVPEDALITHALGFRPLLSYIKGAIDCETATAQSQAETRQYAKRQVTWFRNQL